MLRALIFDFDGLLVDTETALIDAWVQMHAADGLPCNRKTLHSIVGHTGINHDYWAAYAPDIDRETLEARYRETATKLTLDAPPLPGTIALLNAAREADLKIGLASNSSHHHVEGHLNYRSMRGYFDCIVCREDVFAGKPEPDVYLTALRSLGIAAHETIAFEDSAPGHVAAHRAGLHVVVVPNPSTAHLNFPYAHWQLPSLASITLMDLKSRFG